MQLAQQLAQSQFLQQTNMKNFEGQFPMSKNIAPVFQMSATQPVQFDKNVTISDQWVGIEKKVKGL